MMENLKVERCDYCGREMMLLNNGRRMCPICRKTKERHMTEVDETNIYYKNGYKAILTHRHECKTDIRLNYDVVEKYYEIHADGLIVGKPGFAWDFASGAFDTSSIRFPTLRHDIICRAIIENKIPKHPNKEIGDKLFKEDCRRCGMSWFRTRYCFYFVNKYSCTGDPKLIKSSPDIHAADKYNYENTQGAA